MIPVQGVLGWFASTVQDGILKGCILLAAAGLGFVGLEMKAMREEFALTRTDFGRHTSGMYERLDGTMKVMTVLSSPNPERPSEMLLFKFLYGYDEVRKEIVKLRENNDLIPGIAADVRQIKDRLLPSVAKGKP